MIKSVLFFVFGAAAMFLYLNPKDVDGFVETAKQAVHEGATFVQERTK